MSRWPTAGSPIIDVGRGPTDDKSTVTLETPRDLDRVTSFLNIRVADIQAAYADWSARGADFLTPPIERETEIRCYLRDPDDQGSLSPEGVWWSALSTSIRLNEDVAMNYLDIYRGDSSRPRAEPRHGAAKEDSSGWQYGQSAQRPAASDQIGGYTVGLQRRADLNRLGEVSLRRSS